MFYLDKGDIYIHRGDSANFDIVFGQHLAMSSYGNGIIPPDQTIVDAWTTPSLQADVDGKKLRIGVNPSSFPIYDYDNHLIIVREVWGIDWVPEDGTPIRITVKCDNDKRKPVIQKDYVVYNGFVSVDLMPRDTKYLPFGEYSWDFRLNFDNADFVEWNTPFNPMKFTVCEVVGNNY